MFGRKQKQRSKSDRKIDVELIYEDKKGNKWYTYTNPMAIPAKRAIAAEVATRFAEMNLTKDNLITLMAEMKKKAVDPIRAEVVARFLLATAEEMGATLIRTAFSPNIKERADCSTAIFDAQGQVIALAQRVPVTTQD